DDGRPGPGPQRQPAGEALRFPDPRHHRGPRAGLRGAGRALPRPGTAAARLYVQLLERLALVLGRPRVPLLPPGLPQLHGEGERRLGPEERARDAFADGEDSGRLQPLRVLPGIDAAVLSTQIHTEL